MWSKYIIWLVVWFKLAKLGLFVLKTARLNKKQGLADVTNPEVKGKLLDRVKKRASIAMKTTSFLKGGFAPRTYRRDKSADFL